MTTESSGTDTRRRFGAAASTSTPHPPTGLQAPLGATVALTVSLALAAFGIVLAAVLLVVEPTPVPGLTTLAQRQDAETALYLVAFAVVLPLALLTGPRVADSIAQGPNGRAFTLLAAVLAGTLAVAVLVARLLPDDGPGTALGALAVWSAAAMTILARARSSNAWPWALRAAGRAGWAWRAAGALVLVSLLAFASLDSISAVPLALGAAACLGILALHWRGKRLPRVSRAWGLAVDLAIVFAIALLVPDLLIFEPGGGLDAAFKASVIQFHQDFLIGPANQVLAGDAMLVDTSSQYGVLPIYLLAGWFGLAPIGYGTLGFLDGVLYVLTFGAGYCVLRLAGASRVLAGGALALAVVALIWALEYPVGGLLQHGPLRFGLPVALILAAAAGARWPDRSRVAQGVALAIVGLSSIWALEAFAYTVVTFAGVVSLQAWAHPGPRRIGWAAAQGGVALAACAAAHVVLAVATLLFAGELPDWGQYLDYLDALLVGGLADITYDFPAWSPGLVVGAAYAASAVGVVLLAVRRSELIERERPAITALAGTTAYGIALFTYFDNRSAADILPYVCFPAIVLGALWLSLLMRGSLTDSRRVRLGGLAFTLAVSLLVLATAWSTVAERFPRTPLGYAVPGGESLGGAMSRLWGPPPIDRRAPIGQLLLDRYMPGQERVPILVSPELGVEILIRDGRAHALPFADPVQDFFANHPTEGEMLDAIAQLEPGDPILMQTTGLEVLDELQSQPSRDPIADPLPVASPDTLTGQQQWLLQQIAARFRLRVIHQDEQGFVVVELEQNR